MLADVVTGEELRKQLAELGAAIGAAVKPSSTDGDRPEDSLSGRAQPRRVRDAGELLQPDAVAEHARRIGARESGSESSITAPGGTPAASRAAIAAAVAAAAVPISSATPMT